MDRIIDMLRNIGVGLLVLVSFFLLIVILVALANWLQGWFVGGLCILITIFLSGVIGSMINDCGD